MRKKLLTFIFAICFLPCVLFLSACKDDKFELELSDGTNSGNILEYTYNYGDSLDVFDNLTFNLVYSNGNSEQITDGITLSYTYKDENRTTINSSTVLDVGFYIITYNYKDKCAYIYISIESIDSSLSYSIGFYDVANSQSTSSYKYNSDDENYKIVITDNNSNKLNSNEFDYVYALTEEQKTEYSSLTNFDDKQAYLEEHNELWLDFYGDNNFIYTSRLHPNDYYLFAYVYSRGNYNACYSEPISKITVEKGDFKLTDEQVAELNPFVNYTFGINDNYKLNTFNPDGTTLTKALTLGELESLIDYENATISLLGMETAIWTFGHFEFLNPNERVDCSDNGKEFTAKFVLDGDYYLSCYNVAGLNEYSIKLNLEQGKVGLDYIAKDYTYNGQPIYFAGTSDEWFAENSLLSVGYNNITTSATGITQTNAGLYTAKFELIDKVNYVWNEYSAGYQEGTIKEGVISFDWSIDKMAVGSQIYSKITYNGEVPSSNDINYVAGVNEVQIELLEDVSDYLTYRIENETPFTWTIGNIENMDAYLDVNSKGLSNTLTLISIGDIGAFITITITAPGDDNFEAFYLDITISFTQGDLSEEEINLLKEEIPFTTSENGNKATNSITLEGRTGETGTEYYLPDNAIPTTSNDLGVWKLFCGETEYSNGAKVETDSINWYYLFVPENQCLSSVIVYVEVTSETAE
ncbi:MAG: hypothetical protein ACI4PF_01440 [Christensenellales bacterium]